MAPTTMNQWFSFYPGDYLRDTMRLSTLQHGAFFLLLLAYYSEEKPLPNNDDDLANITRLSLRDWRVMKPTISKLFTITETEWRNKRADAEIAKRNQSRSELSEAGRKGMEKRYGMVITPLAHPPNPVITPLAHPPNPVITPLAHPPNQAIACPQPQPQPQVQPEEVPPHPSERGRVKRLHGIPENVEEVIAFCSSGCCG